VEAVEIVPMPRPRTARVTAFHKIFGILEAERCLGRDEFCWYHDVDAFQLRPIPASPSARPLAHCLYTTRERLLVQGGSLFFSAVARPIFEEVFDCLLNRRCRTDEVALTDATGLPRFTDHFEVIDFSYNLGTTDFELRYQLSKRPIKVVHFHHDSAEHRAVFLHGANSLGAHPLPERFLRLSVEHGLLRAEEAAAAAEARRRPAPAPLRRVYTSTGLLSISRLLSRSA
jgi:hypothetical protein